MHKTAYVGYFFSHFLGSRTLFPTLPGVTSARSGEKAQAQQKQQSPPKKIPLEAPKSKATHLTKNQHIAIALKFHG